MLTVRLLFSFIFFISAYFAQHGDDLYHFGINSLNYRSEAFRKHIGALFKDTTKPYEIFHIGDSHLQMGNFSTGISKQFKANDIELEEGWILPKGVFKNLVNKQVEIHFSGKIQAESTNDEQPNLPLGITGRSFSLLNPNTKIKITSKSEAGISTVEFLHQTDDQPIFKAKGAKIEIKLLSDRWCITKLIFNEQQPSVSFQIRNRKYKHVTFSGMRINYRPKGIHYSNFGVSGLTFRECIRAKEIASQMAVLKPDLLVISLGTNDSYVNALVQDTFRYQLRFFCEQLKKFNPETEILFMTAPYTSYKGSPPSKLTMVNEEIRLLCKEQEIALWDWEKVIGGDLLFKNWQTQYLVTKDQLHFSNEGYMLIGKLFAEALLKL